MRPSSVRKVALSLEQFKAQLQKTAPAGTNRKTIFSGIQPTGIPHLGNYLGALSNWVHLQNASSRDDRLIFSVVDLHAITVPQPAHKLRQDRLNAMTTLLAIGIDPERCILFHQSAVQEHSELAWILGCLTPLGRLSRMTAYKEKAAKGGVKNERLGLFAYPVLQAADILAYKATHVPVGEDQRQHLELTRSIAELFNHTVQQPTFPVPESLITPSKRVLSLRNPPRKMSKSDDQSSTIFLTDSRDDIRIKIGRALTDSVPGPLTFDPVNRPGLSNLFSILAALSRPASSSQPGPSESVADDAEGNGDLDAARALAEKYTNYSMRELKELVSDTIELNIRDIREGYFRLKEDEGYVNGVAEKGAEKAREVAAGTLKEVKSLMGLN